MKKSKKLVTQATQKKNRKGVIVEESVNGRCLIKYDKASKRYHIFDVTDKMTLIGTRGNIRNARYLARHYPGSIATSAAAKPTPSTATKTLSPPLSTRKFFDHLTLATDLQSLLGTFAFDSDGRLWHSWGKGPNVSGIWYACDEHPYTNDTFKEAFGSGGPLLLHIWTILQRYYNLRKKPSERGWLCTSANDKNKDANDK